MAEQIANLRDTLGIHYLNLLPAFFGQLPAPLLRRSLQLFAAEVMRQFAEVSTAPAAV
ncbi:MAG: hypothetical protein NTZ05_05585 [Chloroflexi bacterium]|nr:hypothetical protein [Chloroflexota bacterium]